MQGLGPVFFTTFVGVVWIGWGVVMVVWRHRFAMGARALWHEGHLIDFQPFWRELFRSGQVRTSGALVGLFAAVGVALVIVGILRASRASPILG